MSSADPKRVMVVGAGRIAGLNEMDPLRAKPCTHVGAVRISPALELAGIVDADPERARHFAESFSVDWHGTSISKAVSELRPDIVTVAVPYRLQRDVVEALLDAPHRPRRLLLEKPLAANLADAEWIVNGAVNAGISVLVNNECGAPVIDQLCGEIRGRPADDVISVSAWCSSGMHAVGVHMLGILVRLLGDVAWVRAVGETERVEALPFSTNFVPDDPRVHAMFGFESGATAFLTNSALTDYTCKELEVMCRSGKVRLSDNGRRLQVWRTATPGASTISYTLDEPEEIEIDRATVFSRIAHYLAADDEAAGQEVLGAGMALKVYRILDALLASARTGQDVRLFREAAAAHAGH